MRNDYGIFFHKPTAGTTQVVRLPVNPAKLPITQGNANETANVLGIGPVMIPRIPELIKISIESYFPGRIDSLTLTSGQFLPPEFYIEYFLGAMLNKEQVVLTISRVHQDGIPYYTSDTGLTCLVTDFQYEERGGETGDFYYTLELTEYRDYSAITMQIQTNGTGGQPITAVAETQRTTPNNTLVVGATAKLNGAYYYSSYGDEPHGNKNGLTVKVSRIVTNDDNRAYPIHVTTESGGALGWVKKSSLQVVSE